MTTDNWMLYGATGYTGVLVAEEALRRGHRPLLAGRSAKKLAPLAERLGLDYVAFSLDNVDAIVRNLADINLVYHAAGPFIHTSEPILRACLQSRTHYLDIAGEYFIFQNTFSHSEAALQAGIALISGVGFDVVPSDCLLKHVSDQIPNAIQLETGIDALSRVSAGTVRSLLEMMPSGGRVRRDGELVAHPFGKGTRKIRFPHGQFSAMPIPWGDIETGYHTTSIPNITAYMALPSALIALSRITAPIGQFALKSDLLRQLLGGVVDRVVHGPDEHARQTSCSYLWARATGPDGNFAESWIETVEVYRFTAEIGVRCVEKVLELQPIGALTPSQAFGADFVLEVEGTKRYDSLPG